MLAQQDPFTTSGTQANTIAGGAFVTGIGGLAMALTGLGMALMHNHDVIAKLGKVIVGVGVAIAAAPLVTWAGHFLGK